VGCSVKKVLDKGRLIYYVEYYSRSFIFDCVPLRLYKGSDKGKPKQLGGTKLRVTFRTWMKQSPVL